MYPQTIMGGSGKKNDLGISTAKAGYLSPPAVWGEVLHRYQREREIAQKVLSHAGGTKGTISRLEKGNRSSRELLPTYAQTGRGIFSV